MRSRSVFQIIFVASIFTTLNSLKFRQDRIQHFQRNQIWHNMQSVMLHRIAGGHDQQIPENFLKSLKENVSNDTEITNRIHAQLPLLKTEAEKVKNYFLQNEDFQEFTIKNLVTGTSDPHCLDVLNKIQRKKLFKIILDQIDFSTIFLSQKHEQQFRQQQVHEIIFELKTDKQLYPYLKNCFSKGNV